jgi:hypothetical protein
LNFICVHLEGSKNAIADYISRIAFVDENVVTSDIHPKTAQHVVPTFSPMQIITKDEIEKALRENPNIVTKCNDPDNCRSNVNAQLYRGLDRLAMSLRVCRKQRKSLIIWLKQLCPRRS